MFVGKPPHMEPKEKRGLDQKISQCHKDHTDQSSVICSVGGGER